MKKSITYLGLILTGFLMFSCDKEEPICESCTPTLLNTNFRSKLVGEWLFYEQLWIYGAPPGPVNYVWKDSNDLGHSYKIKVTSDGLFSLYQDDSLLKTHKLTVYQEEEYDSLANTLGYYYALFDCDNSYEPGDRFKSRLLTLDTMSVEYFPVITSQPGVTAGPGYFKKIE